MGDRPRRGQTPFRFPRPAARAVTVKNDKLLLVYNGRDDFYYLPGGKVEFGESLKDCIKRELEEEADTTLEVEFKKLLFANEFLSEDGRHKIELIALVEIDKFQEIDKVKDPQHDGRSVLEWVSLDQLPDNIIPKEMGDEIKRSAKNRFESVEFTLFTSFV